MNRRHGWDTYPLAMEMHSYQLPRPTPSPLVVWAVENAGRTRPLAGVECIKRLVVGYCARGYSHFRCTWKRTWKESGRVEEIGICVVVGPGDLGATSPAEIAREAARCHCEMNTVWGHSVSEVVPYPGPAMGLPEQVECRGGEVWVYTEKTGRPLLQYYSLGDAVRDINERAREQQRLTYHQILILSFLLGFCAGAWEQQRLTYHQILILSSLLGFCAGAWVLRSWW